MKSSKLNLLTTAILCLGLVIIGTMAGAQDSGSTPGPDPREIPVPKIKTPLGTLPGAVRRSILGAQPAYALFNAKERLGVNYAKHGHAFTAEDWTAMMDFFDKHLRGKKIDRTFE